jgi:hypothetical protein
VKGARLLGPVLLGATLLVAGCDRPATRAPRGDTAGDRLEAAAIAAGIVSDPARADPVGLYAGGDDRMCVVPRGGAGGYSVGIVVRYDDGQGCTARGVAARDGEALRIGLTDGGGDDCRFTARFEGDRIVLPATLPEGCDRRCTGRATLAALSVDRLSDGTAEASAQRDRQDEPLCAS